MTKSTTNGANLERDRLRTTRSSQVPQERNDAVIIEFTRPTKLKPGVRCLISMQQRKYTRA